MNYLDFTTEELANEIWKDVTGYEGVYSVSSIGRVRRDLAVWVHKGGRILNPSRDSRGYHQVKLCLKPSQITFKIHKLVAVAFMGKCPDGLQVNHIDGNKDNNKLSNLEYITGTENIRHAFRLGLYKGTRGERNGNSKLKDKEIPQIHKLRSQGRTLKEIGSLFGVTESTIWTITKGKTRRASNENR
jgi:hypothetical protein